MRNPYNLLQLTIATESRQETYGFMAETRC